MYYFLLRRDLSRCRAFCRFGYLFDYAILLLHYILSIKLKISQTLLPQKLIKLRPKIFCESSLAYIALSFCEKMYTHINGSDITTSKGKLDRTSFQRRYSRQVSVYVTLSRLFHVLAPLTSEAEALFCVDRYVSSCPLSRTYQEPLRSFLKGPLPSKYDLAYTMKKNKLQRQCDFRSHSLSSIGPRTGFSVTTIKIGNKTIGMT